MLKVSAVFSLKDTHRKKFLSIFLVRAFSLITLLAILISIHIWETTRHNLDLVMQEEQNHMELAENLFHQELERMSINLLTFTGTPSLQYFFANPSDQAARQSLNAGLSNYFQNRKDHDQTQVMDNNGRELIRVEKRDQQTAIIPIEELESKSKNVPFDEDLHLQVQGQTAIAPMDLARDQKGNIARPLHPILQLAAPIFDQHNHKVGVLQFTYQGQQFLDLLSKVTAHHHDSGALFNCTPQIVNQGGYWLLAPDKEDEWGFVHDPQRRFDRRFPEIWTAMLARGQGQIKTKDGLFTFTTLPLVSNEGSSRDTNDLHPANLTAKAQQDGTPFWLLISQVSPQELALLNADTMRFHLILFLVVLAGSLPLLWWITQLLRKEQEDKEQLQAEKKRTAHLNILLQTIIKIHRLIDQEKERQELVQSCCDILIASRGYASAWIFLLDQNGKIAINAESGLRHNLGLLKQQINLGNPPPCIRECRAQQNMVVIDTPIIFCNECPMADSYPRSGVMCASLEHDSHVYGYLNVSLPIDFIEDQEEKDRFSEIASDIGYALFNLEQQQKKLQAETSLHQSEVRLRSITDSAQDAILMMDSQGLISFWNPAAEAILGYRAEEALGRDLHTLLAPLRYHAAFHAALPEFVRTGHGNMIGKTLELAALHKDGREIPVALSLSSIFQNENWEAVGILRDITDRKLIEEQMLQSEKMSTIAGLAAGVAHEINTPLSAILQSIQVIRQSLDPELARNQEIAGHCGLDLAKAQDYFQKREINFFMDGIRESAIKSGKIIANLLQFSRPQKMESAPADLSVLLDKSVELAKNDYVLKKNHDILNIEISREYTPNLLPVSCVAMEIEQVFINLLKNAAQAMSDQPEPKPKPRIILRTRQQGEMIQVEIADNGPGMDEKTKRHIFDPFFTTKDIGVGAGLGLSVSYTIIVTKHGGQLTVHSELGQGTTFTINLPLNNERQQQEKSSAQ